MQIGGTHPRMLRAKFASPKNAEAVVDAWPRVGHARHPNSDSSETDEDPIMPWEVDYGPW